MPRSLIVIPARMQATRLPGKPMALIAGEPMIVHVWRRAMAANAGDVLVATDAEEIRQAIEVAGGQAMMTRADHASGSDRIYEAVCAFDPQGERSLIVNLQGDLPTLEPHLVSACLAPLENDATDIATLAAPISEAHERDNPNVVKAVGTTVGMAPNMMRALYFTRATAPSGDGTLYHHIGIYAYRRSALERFVSLQPSPLEQREKLEQLRALEDGMRMDIAIVDTVPLGVDTPADLSRAESLISMENKA